jgi:hypothetical protein
MFSWLTDQVGASAAGAQVDMTSYVSITVAGLSSALVSQYIQDIPSVDGWKGTYAFYLDTANPLARTVMAIGSGGRNKSAVGGTYTVGSFDPTDYDQDIVWADGFFVRWPQKGT